MKIAIPTRDCRIDDHFGHCDHYTIYTIENKTIAARLAGFILDSGKRCAGHDGAHRCDGHGHEHTHECGH